MPEQPDEEDIEEMVQVYAETENVSETAERTGWSRPTIDKYVEQAEENGHPLLVEDEGVGHGSGGDEWMGAGPDKSPFDDAYSSVLETDYDELSPGGFLEEFFDDFEVGVRSSWVAIQGRRAERRDTLPSKESLKADLLHMNSGINKSSIQEAEYIAQEYWAEAQQYLHATGRSAEADPVSSPQQQQQQQQWGPYGQQGMGQQPMGRQQGMQQGQQQQGPQKQMMQMMMREFRKMREEMSEKLEQNASGGGGDDRLQRLEELQREKEILEQLSEDSGEVSELKQQLSALQQQIMQDAQGQPMPGGGGGGSFEDQLLSMAANSESVSLREVLEIIDSKDDEPDDPELLEKKYDKELKEMELREKKERQEMFADKFESLTERLGEKFTEELFSTDEQSRESQDVSDPVSTATDGAGETDTSSDAPAPDDMPDIDMSTPAATESAVETQECKNCGDNMVMTQTGAHCTACEYGVGPCDLCGHPVEIPAIGDANYARCADCENVIEVPDDDTAEITCAECGWEGTGAGLRGEVLECDNCGEYRPIVRQGAAEEQQSQMMDLLQD